MTMRRPSWLIGNKTRFDMPESPPVDGARMQARINSVRRSFRRRLTDQIEDVFDAACLSGDLETAEALLAAHACAAARRSPLPGPERRIAAGQQARLEDILAQRRQACSRSGHESGSHPMAFTGSASLA